MQLLAEHKTLDTVKDLRMDTMNGMLIPDISSHNLEAKEKSSNSSLLLMNPVASGDNVATGLNSAHKILPPLIPCCEGRELKINEDLVCSGLSAISVRHDGVMQCMSMSCACEKQIPPGLVKHRNSFRSLHRPDLKRVPYLRRMTPEELEALFRGYADVPTLGSTKDDQENVNKVVITLNKTTGKRDTKETKTIGSRDDGNSCALRPIPETQSGAEDVPAGMRLHGTRAMLYTSVLAGAKAGDRVESASPGDEYDAAADAELPEDEVQLSEELQTLLPPRRDDVTAAPAPAGDGAAR